MHKNAVEEVWLTGSCFGWLNNLWFDSHTLLQDLGPEEEKRLGQALWNFMGSY